jgi:hypothetical protein
VAFRCELRPGDKHWSLNKLGFSREKLLQFPSLVVHLAEGVIESIATAHDWCDSGKVGPQAQVHQVKETYTVLIHRNSIIDAGKLAVIRSEDLGLGKFQVAGQWVEDILE